jgi:hypothetical protein
MPIVFDQIDGVVQRNTEQAASDPDASAEDAPTQKEPERLSEQLARLHRRRERLRAD